eukprot:665393-Alexandrium_andersonii.AAC.1
MCILPGLTYRIHFIVHVGGINHGGIPQTCPDGEKVIRTYVGDGSGYNFRDPDDRRGRQADPISGCEYNHCCTGQNGFMQRAMIDASLSLIHI